ncbi:hypothetical protein ERAQ111492_01025 [Erysipelothrix aquatica]
MKRKLVALFFFMIICYSIIYSAIQLVLIFS